METLFANAVLKKVNCAGQLEVRFENEREKKSDKCPEL